VRHYWALEGKPEKNRVISRDWAYHGSTIAGASLGGMAAMHDQLHGAVPNIVHVMPPYAYELAEAGESDEEFGLRAARALEDAILEAGPDKVAAFIGEPVMGAGGVKIPPASYWPEIQRICRKYDVLLMLDEVITGYGRRWASSPTRSPPPRRSPRATSRCRRSWSATASPPPWSRRAANSFTATPIPAIRSPARWR
jgi:putrescine aminotransferase